MLHSPVTRRFFARALAVSAALAAATLTLSSCARLEPRAPGPRPQAPAPDFRLTDHQGREVALADMLASGPAVVVFYRGHW